MKSIGKSFLLILIVGLAFGGCRLHNKIRLYFKTPPYYKKLNPGTMPYLIKYQEKVKINQLDSALFFVNKADSLSPDNHTVLLQRLKLNFHLIKNYNASLEDINKSLVIVGKHRRSRQSLLIWRGDVHKLLGNMDAACDDWKQGGREGKRIYRQECR